MNNLYSFRLFNRTIYSGFILLALVCLGFMFAEIINHRFWLSDFEVYYKAASRILSGNNLYRYAEDDHYIFKYSPVSAIYFIPFTLFKFVLAKYIYWIFLTLVILTGFYLSIRLIRPALFERQNSEAANSVILLAGLILAVHFLRELHLGQVNYLLLFIFILAAWCYSKSLNVAFALLLAVSLFFKPFALIFIPYMIIKKNYRELLLLILFTLVLAVAPVLFYDSFATAWSQYIMWMDELRIELSHKQGLLEDANHTLFSVVARYTPVRWFLGYANAAIIYQLILLGLTGWFTLHFIRLRSKHTANSESTANPVSDFALLIALIPLMAFTSENAFVFSQLLVFYIVIYFGKLKTYEKVLAVVGFLFIGGNFSEATGRELSKILNDLSLVTIGAMILIYLLYVLKRRDLLTGNG